MQPISPRTYKVIFLIILLAIGFGVFAQAPNLLNYQGVARNAVGNPLPNQAMNLRLSVHNLSAMGTVLYSETRPITTNLGGLFSVQIGSAGTTSSTGTLGGVNWLSGDKYLKVEIDPASNNNYLNLGTVQLVSVPYAFNSATAGNATTANKLAAPKNINGVAFDGSADISIAAAASAELLTGTSIKSTVTGSSLTTVGTLTNLTVTNPIAGSITGNAATATLASTVTTNANLSGDVTSVGNATTVKQINGTPLSGLATGILKNTTSTGVPSIAVAGTDYLTPTGSAAGLTNFPTLNQKTTGNAATATKLEIPKNINGVAFDGTGDITVTADAETLTGNTLKSTVTGSSLTSVGTLANLTVTNPIAGSVTGNAATATKLAAPKNINGVAFDGSADITITAAAAAEQLTGTTLKSTVTGSSITSVGTLTSATVNGKVIVGASSAASSSAVLEVSSTTQGFLPPRLTAAQRNAINSPADGLIVFNTTSNSLNVFFLGNWHQLSTTLPQGTIASLDASSLTNTGSLIHGLFASSVSSLVSYTGGNGEVHSGQTVASTGVTGLTAILLAGSFAVGNGTLTYTITGTPSSAGTASFALNIGGQTAILTRTVVPGGITSLDASSPTNNGSLIHGLLASSVSSVVSYTGGNGGSQSGQTVASTGVTGLTATLIAGNFAVGNGTITYSITGTPSSAGTASFALNIGGQTATLIRTVVPGGITSLAASSPTNTGSLIHGLLASSVSSVVSYTGGNGGSHNGQTIASTGVLGLTATLNAGNFAAGDGTLTYTISGTPTSAGTASFALNIGGQTATLTRTVDPGLIASLSASSPTTNGSLYNGLAASGVSSVVSYTGGNGGPHSGQTVLSTGVLGLTATLTSGNFTNGSGTLTYAITGTPSSGGTASFALNIGGQTATLTRTVEPGSITSLSASSPINTGSLVHGLAASSVSSVVSYAGGNGETHNGQTVASTGVTGLTATLVSGSFANGVGTLTYSIAGTPSSAGTASFALNIGGQTATLTRTVDSGLITALSVNLPTNNGLLVHGVAASGVSSVVSYAGGNGGPHSGQTVSSTGVTGLTATLTASNFAAGNGTLTYTISGTPASSGTASFALNIGGQTATLTRTVDPGLIASLNATPPTNNGTLVHGLAASGVTSLVSYSGGNGGTHSGQTVSSTGVTGLTATLIGDNFAAGDGTLTYTISGTPASAGTASFALNIGGKTATLTRTVVPGSVTSLDASLPTNTGSLFNGYSASSVSSVSYTGGNGGFQNGQTVTSTGVTGLTATLISGNFAVGNGILTYNITGTSSNTGTASFALNIGGQTATLTLEVSTLAIGASYQAGKIAYILQLNDPGYDPIIPHGFIAANADQSTGIEWGPNNTATGSIGTAIGTGLANTNTIITRQGAEAVNYAAAKARSYRGGSYSDWYLPSKDELQKLYDNKASLGNNFAAQTYHSSSESPRYEGDTWAAWMLSFGPSDINYVIYYGWWHQWDKLNPFAVRAVRAF